MIQNVLVEESKEQDWLMYMCSNAKNKRGLVPANYGNNFYLILEYIIILIIITCHCYVSCHVYYPIKNRLCSLIYELNVKNLPNMSLIAIISLDLQYGLVLQ